MTTLNLVLDELLASEPSEISIYASELAKALIDHAPPGCFVEGIVASSSESDYAEIAALLPGLRGLFKSALTRRDLTTAWQHGFTPVPSGMIHAPSLFAPLRNHDRVNSPGSQVAVSISDVVAWSHPELLAPRQVSWTKAMARRALKYADAIVVPTHAVADELAEYLPFGDRVRVVSGAVRSGLLVPGDADVRSEKLGLPAVYIAASATGTSSSAVATLLEAVRSTTLPLVLIADSRTTEAATAEITAAGLPADRVKVLTGLSDSDLSVVLDRAELFVHASTVDGFGMAMLEAFRFGTPVIHSDARALVEVAGEAGLTVAAGDTAAYPAALAAAIERVHSDAQLRATLGILGADRAKFFSWRAAAEGIWQLHADL